MTPFKIGKLALLTGVAFAVKGNAQTVERTVVASDGGIFLGTAQSISWTIGEPCSESLTANNRLLTQGFQQPQIKFSPSSVDTYPSQEGQLLVYPNPVDQFLNLNFEDLPAGEYISELYDMRGALINNFRLQVAEGNQTIQLDLGYLRNAEYILRVRAVGNPFSRSIKIFHLNPY